MHKKSWNQLAVYLDRRLQYLTHCNWEIEEHFTSAVTEILDRLDRGELERDDPAVGRSLADIDFVLANTHRYCMLVAVCTFLEEAAKVICKARVTDYRSKLKSVKGKNLNWLQRHVKLLRQEISFAPGPLLTEIRRFNNFIRLRNCVVHCWGKIREDKYRRSIRAALKRIGDVAEFKDGYLAFGDQVVLQAIVDAEAIKDGLLKCVSR